MEFHGLSVAQVKMIYNYRNSKKKCDTLLFVYKRIISSLHVHVITDKILNKSMLMDMKID